MTAVRNIFISVAEHSADLHAARLVELARQRHPAWRFSGLTGPRLRSAGVATVFDFTQHAAMLTGIVRLVGRARAALRAAEEAWDRTPPDAVVVMDSSALHLQMAARATARGLKTLYYIAPQTWASRAYRNRRLARDLDRVACILPFEATYLRKQGVDAHFVGHPLFESLTAEQPDEAIMASLRQAGRPTIALLPGSREQVIKTMLPLQLAAVRDLDRAATVGVSCVAANREKLVRDLIAQSGVAAEIVTDANASLLTAADLVLTASGTATLHVAAYRKPMIVMYTAAGWLRWPHRLGGRLVLKLPHLSLVNILAGRRVVPEFMPFIPRTAPITAMAAALLDDPRLRERQVAGLDAVVRPLEQSAASDRVCALLAELLGASGR